MSSLIAAIQNVAPNTLPPAAQQNLQRLFGQYGQGPGGSYLAGGGGNYTPTPSSNSGAGAGTYNPYATGASTARVM